MKPTITTIPDRPDVPLHKRVPLNRNEVAELCLRQQGRCGCNCGERLQPLTEGIVDEHWVPLALGGTNDLTNRYLLRKPCARCKTDTADTPARAKVKRLRGETGQAPKRPIKNRGFGRVNRKLNGSTGPTQRAKREGEQ